MINMAKRLPASKALLFKSLESLFKRRITPKRTMIVVIAARRRVSPKSSENLLGSKVAPI